MIPRLNALHPVEHRKQREQVIEDLMKTESAFLIGSAGLGLPNPNDKDIVIESADFDSVGAAKVAQFFEEVTHNYWEGKSMKCLPLENLELYRGWGYDIIVVNSEVWKGLALAMGNLSTLQDTGMFDLHDKATRITLFDLLVRAQPSVEVK